MTPSIGSSTHMASRAHRVPTIAVLFALLLVFGVLTAGCSGTGPSCMTDPSPADVNTVTNSTPGDEALAQAFARRAVNSAVEGQGTVYRLLPDDTEGSRHQRFLVELASGQTLLIAHNIDIAPRIDSLRMGDTIQFKGVYEWNSQGGVIHWTHHDPTGIHKSGWILHDGHRYQ